MVVLIVTDNFERCASPIRERKSKSFESLKKTFPIGVCVWWGKNCKCTKQKGFLKSYVVGLMIRIHTGISVYEGLLSLYFECASNFS